MNEDENKDENGDNYKEGGGDDEANPTPHASHEPGTWALRHLRDAVNEDFFDEDDDSEDDAWAVTTYTSPVRRGRPTTNKFGKNKPWEGASYQEIEAYEKERKAHYDLERMKKLRSPNKRMVSEYTGNHHPTLHTMADVEKVCLSRGSPWEVVYFHRTSHGLQDFLRRNSTSRRKSGGSGQNEILN